MRNWPYAPVRLPEPHWQPVQRIVALAENAMRLRRLCGDRKKICQCEISDQSSWQRPGKQEEWKSHVRRPTLHAHCEYGEYREIKEPPRELPCRDQSGPI